ncbi:MAG: deoxyribonuclease IV [Gemmatimonadota bacterium]
MPKQSPAFRPPSPSPSPSSSAAIGPLGAHVSTAGGIHSSIPRAKAIAATAMQLFTKQANQWKEPAIGPEDGARFRHDLGETDVAVSNAHDSYLINLASPNPELWNRSLISFVSELRRCETLQLTYLVSHPGNFMDDRADGLSRNAEAISIALDVVPGQVTLLMEMTAGSGTALGASFEEMAALLARIDPAVRGRVGVCVDTAHIFAAGYDIVHAYDDVWARFGDTIGFERLGMMHLNDSKVPFASRKDRHELIGEGAIGEGAFRRIMTDPRLTHVAKVIETPKGDEPEVMDTKMLNRLRAYARGE